MATALSNKVPELIDDNWENQSPDERLRSIERISAGGDSGQQALVYIAHHDTHADVRCGAVCQLYDISALIALQDATVEVAAAATQQYHRILAGTVDSDLDEAARLDIIRTLPLPAAKQIALLAKCKAAGSEAVARIDAAEELADLSLFATSAHVRKLAIMKIDDKKLLTEIREKIRETDKTVYKLIEKKLGNNAAEQSQALAKPVAATSNDAPQQAVSQPPVQDGAAEKPVAAADDAPTTPGKTTAAESASAPVPKAAKPKKTKQAPVPEVAPDPVTELPRLEQVLSKLSYKNTEVLNSARNSLNKVRKVAAAASPELEAQAAALHTTMTEKLDKNRAYQEQLQQQTSELLQQLQQALDAGQSHDALPTWDKIQGNISNTSGKIRSGLQKQANVHKEKLNELRDWKAFAATEKKKELIAQMQHLLESKMHAADRSKHIGKMHQEWKSLGRSNQNEQLWREFKKLSDKAYEPCKEYFKQRKQLLATNYARRREICELLESELAKVDADNPNISELNKLLNQTGKDWKESAPIEQSKIKSMQKRYFAAVNQLRKVRKHSLRGNGAQKQEFIAQANALAQSEDRQHAMSEAKRLQQEWKKIGPTSFREDRQYWEDFRAACDKIFEKRNQEGTQHHEKSKQDDGRLHEILQAIEAVLALDDAAFRESRAQYQELAQQFSNSPQPRHGHQAKRLQEQFNGLKRKIDTRFKLLPDKKQLLLKTQVMERAKLLRELEEQLFACTDDAQFLAVRERFDRAAWDALAASGNKNYDKALQDRLQCILQSNSLQALRDAAQKCAKQVRTLCIELEIRANIDTPTEDQNQRMQIQLAQLKNGFGKLKPDPKENSTFAMEAELHSACLGPLESNEQKLFSERLAGAIRKLL